MVTCRKLLTIAFLTMAIASNCYGRKAAVNDFSDHKVSATQRLIYDIFDYFIGEEVSLTDVSPEVEQYVRGLQNKIGMEDTTIRLRSMSREALRMFGRENAAVVSIPFANTMLISEDWFNSLPEKEKRALIGHELAHIKNKHAYKKLAFSILCAPFLIFSFIPVQMYSRHCELEADKISALEFDNIDGCIDLFRRFKELRDPHSRFVFKQILRRIRKFITYPIRTLAASHPKLSTRIKDLETLAKLAEIKKREEELEKAE